MGEAAKPDVVELKCGGGCGATIKVPAKWAESVKDGKQDAPLCINCLGGTRAKGKTVLPTRRSTATASTEQGQGKAPAYTTLIARKVWKGGRRRRLAYVTEVHPCPDELNVPEAKLLMEFSRALADRARLLLQKKGRAIDVEPGLGGLPQRLVKRATDGSSVIKQALAFALRKKK